MKIEYIDFILENCEVVHIEGKYICNFGIKDIQTQFFGNSSWALKQEVAKSFFMELHPKANTIHYPLGEKQWKTTAFDRLQKYSDITHIEFVLEGQKYSYAVDWEEDDDTNNCYQTTYESEEGFLYIKVAKDKSILDFFPEEYIAVAGDLNIIFEDEEINNVQEDEETDS